VCVCCCSKALPVCLTYSALPLSLSTSRCPTYFLFLALALLCFAIPYFWLCLPMVAFGNSKHPHMGCVACFCYFSFIVKIDGILKKKLEMSLLKYHFALENFVNPHFTF
jgi:hypothetical protein